MMTMTEDRIETMLVEDPTMLYVWRTDEMDGGLSEDDALRATGYAGGDGSRWLAVYRSPVVPAGDKRLIPYRDVLSAGPFRSEVVTDPDMMFGRAELAMYAL